MSTEDKFWKKPTALEHVASMEAEHKPNAPSMCLFTSAKDLTRWVWDQWKPLKTTASSDLREQEHTLFCTKPKGRRTLWQGRDCKSSQSLHTRTVARHSLALYVDWQESVSFGPKPAACQAFQGTGKQYSLTVSLHSLAVQGLQGKSRDVLQQI